MGKTWREVTEIRQQKAKSMADFITQDERIALLCIQNLGALLEFRVANEPLQSYEVLCIQGNTVYWKKVN